MTANETSRIEEYYNFVLPLIKESGKLFLEVKKETLEVENKSDHDLVTIYDKKIEDTLISKIKAEFPHHRFIGEESSGTKHGTPTLTDDPTWIIDPIDGTTNFVKDIPFTGISVGLVIEKIQVIGIIFIPHLNDLYTAIKGRGAYMNGKKISCSNVQDIKKSLFCYEISVASRSALFKLILTRLQFLTKEVLAVRSFGCPVISLCYVASGKLDAYQCDGLYPWDAAAGTLIVKEAGGYVIDSSGEEFDLMKPNFIATSTKTLAEKYLAIEKIADNTWMKKETDL
ncbi:inositol monophosphatase 2-like [Sitophilus oryzae]|uniref:Inositol-1-monophosphatase n=1 Tax=Sitophilus oryzae TaxID=7048 RepID=A0A6J2Y4E4_SITOR|nr:inositol monophosphatase 2-like [Sitophilus oryzae]XP_030758153.1 inositol monophosphatase 2-like [Sitophilus oryzae]XP_030758154.1 inositol monophosphatase 2-like [Sitophilus oryzae]